jgi:hypothetical protein
MNEMPCKPVLLVLFNKPDTTRQVFEAIRKQRPAELFLAADGPRPERASEREACAEARALTNSVDWPCEVHRRFLDENVGCARGPSEAISWFLEHVENGIILEDDCVPHPSFFRFAGELLDHYKTEPRVMHIAGANFLQGKRRGEGSYYFSKWTFNWGWATWRRAWRHFDITLLPEPYRSHVWDAQWRLSVKRQGGVAIVPNANLVSNVGCGHSSATHTSQRNAAYADLATEEMSFPLRHPRRLRKMDRYTDFSVLRNHNSWFRMLVKKVNRALAKP